MFLYTFIILKLKKKMASKIFISGIDTPLSYHIVERLRKDHIMLENFPIFEGSAANIKEVFQIEHQQKNLKKKNIHESVHRVFKVQKSKNNVQASNFNQLKNENHSVYSESKITQIVKSVLQADLIILNLRNPTPQIQFILKILKFYRFEEQKKIKIIGISTHMTWANTKSHCIKPLNQKYSLLEASLNQDFWNRLTYKSQFYKLRVPHPQFVYNYQLEESLLELFESKSQNISGCVLCCGILYGRQSVQLYEIIKPAIDAKQNTIYGQGNNAIPLFNIDCLTSIIQFFNQAQINQKQKKYFLLSENKSFKTQNYITQQNLIDLIKNKLGNKCQNIIKSNNELCLLKNQLIWSSNVRFEQDQTIKEILSAYSLVSNFQQSLDNTIKQFFQYWDQIPRHFYIPVQLDFESSNSLYQIKKKYFIFDFIKLTDLISKLLRQKIIQTQNQQQETKKKSANNNRKSSLISNQPNKLHVKVALQYFIKSNQYSNYVIYLKKQYFDLISQNFKFNGNQESEMQNQLAIKMNKLRLIVKLNQKRLASDIQVNSKEFLNCFNLSQFEVYKKQNLSQKVLQSSDCQNKNYNQSSKGINNVDSVDISAINQQKQFQLKQNQNKKIQNAYNSKNVQNVHNLKYVENAHNSISQNKNIKSIKNINNKNHSKKQSNLQENDSHPFSLVTQYLLDNLILYVAEARQTININSKLMQKKGRIEQKHIENQNKRCSRTSRQSKLKDEKQEEQQIEKLIELVELLKQIRTRQNLEIGNQVEFQN